MFALPVWWCNLQSWYHITLIDADVDPSSPSFKLSDECICAINWCKLYFMLRPGEWNALSISHVA